MARGVATAGSDIDLAVIADANWAGQDTLEDTIRTRLGNNCDVIAFTSAEFSKLARDGEPVVSDILQYGIALIGDKPRIGTSAA
jgi:hypothetical protein